MEQERREQDEQTEVEGHRAVFGPSQAAEGHERISFEPSERVMGESRSGQDAEDGPEVEGHRYFFGPSKESKDPGRAF